MDDERAGDNLTELQTSLEDQRARFLEAVSSLRPRLHRFCARMCGSVLDGEDIVQDVLIHAFYKLPSLRDQTRLKPWLFRIAHNKCIDLLRRQKPELFSVELEDAPAAPGSGPETGVRVGDAFNTLVTRLPPKERACIVLKDVMDYGLADIADIVNSTEGGVKSALHRARQKLGGEHSDGVRTSLPEEERSLVRAYLTRFNEQDWDGVRELVRADARLELVGFIEGNALDIMNSKYFHNYSKMQWEWKFDLAFVDGQEMAVHFKRTAEGWVPHAALGLVWSEGRVVQVRDYVHIDYLLSSAQTRQDV